MGSALVGGQGNGRQCLGHWRQPVGIGALACHRGRDPTINIRWKGGGETIVIGLRGGLFFL